MNNNFKKRYIQILSEKIHRKQRMINEDPTLGQWIPTVGGWQSQNSEGDYEYIPGSDSINQPGLWQNGDWYGYGLHTDTPFDPSKMVAGGSRIAPAQGREFGSDPGIVYDPAWDEYMEWDKDGDYKPWLDPDIKLPEGYEWRVRNGKVRVVARNTGRIVRWRDLGLRGRNSEWPREWPLLRHARGMYPGWINPSQWGELPDVGGRRNPFNPDNQDWLERQCRDSNGNFDFEKYLQLIVEFLGMHFGWITTASGRHTVLDIAYQNLRRGINSLRSIFVGLDGRIVIDGSDFYMYNGEKRSKLLDFIQRYNPGLLRRYPGEIVRFFQIHGVNIPHRLGPNGEVIIEYDDRIRFDDTFDPNAIPDKARDRESPRIAEM